MITKELSLTWMSQQSSAIFCQHVYVLNDGDMLSHKTGTLDRPEKDLSEFCAIFADMYFYILIKKE